MLTLSINREESPRSAHLTFWVNESQAKAIAQIRQAHKGFGAVKGYKPTTDYKVSPVQNVQFNFEFVVSRLYKKTLRQLNELSLNDLDLSSWVPAKGAKSCATAAEQFELCKQLMTASFTASLERSLENAHTEAHGRNYCKFGNSVKVNFVTVKDEETGKQVPVLDDNGIPTVASILIPYLQIKKVVVVPGEKKVKNSGSKILMDNAIKKAMGPRFQIKQLTLKDNNFESLHLGKQHIDPVDLSEFEEKQREADQKIDAE